MSGKIPVTVLSGFLGSGKTTLLNHLLAAGDASPADAAAAARMVVIVNELGDIGIEHAQARHVSDNIVLLASGCLCCTVRGELVNALRELFMAALQKKIPSFSRVIVETTGIADPAPVIYTLKYERFLSDRFIYDGCVSVVDAVHGAQQLRRDPVAVQQVVLADALVISKTDLASRDKIVALQGQLKGLNAQAQQYLAQNRPGLLELLDAGSLRAGMARPSARMGLWGGRGIGHLLPVHADIQTLTMVWKAPLPRAAFTKVIDLLHADTEIELLRLKGVLWFSGDNKASAVHGVHSELYPIEPLAMAAAPAAPPYNASPRSSQGQLAGAHQDSVLVLIFRGAKPERIQREIAQLLPGGQPLLSRAGNFVQ